MVWDKVEGVGEVRAGGPDETKTDGFGPNQPGPSGFRLADARFVEPLGRCTTSTFASLLPDRTRQTRNRMIP
jgi:hypothetical protein